MSRALAFLVHNWPLKLAAVFLAAVLYGVLVLTQNTQARTDLRIPILRTNEPSDVILLSDLGSVTEVRFFVPDESGIRVDSSSFEATADLSQADPDAATSFVAVSVRAIDDRIRVLDFAPRQISVRVEKVVTIADIPVVVTRTDDPIGFDIREPEFDPATVTVRGPASLVRRVGRVEARIQIDPTGVDFDRDVPLIPVDVVGEPLSPVDVEPTTAHVRVLVFTNGQTRSIPVVANVTGSPAPGFEIAGVTVRPLVLPVEGDQDDLVTLSRLDTEPISINGATSTINRTLKIALPPGIRAVAGDEVQVTITLRPVTATRTFSAGVVASGARSDRTYDLSVDRILVVVGGSVADLDRLEGRTFDVRVEVGGLGPGVHEVPIVANLPAGLALVSADPDTVMVTVTLAATSPAPSAVSP
ncbi:MAG TPA: CdaR family protein [Candidatus Limnocylindrales bacterium]|nr:CdaR family protein [Candidatus Limnocylindrales bacterium]